MKAEYKAILTVKCIVCGKTRDIVEGTDEAQEQPICECGILMVADSARQERKNDSRKKTI